MSLGCFGINAMKGGLLDLMGGRLGGVLHKKESDVFSCRCKFKVYMRWVIQKNGLGLTVL